MFVVRIDLKLRAEKRSAFHEYVRVEGRRARELDGCLDYSFCEDLDDPTRVILYEEWSSRAQFEAYRSSALFAATGARLRPMLAQGPDSAYYESENLFTTCAVR